MTAATKRSAPAGLWIGLLVLVGLIVLVAFLGRDSAATGGPGEPDGTGPDGLAALATFIDEAGGTVVLDVGVPGPEIDFAVLVFPAIPPVNPNDLVAAPPEPDWEPLLSWVEAGGTLVTSVDVERGPILNSSVIDNDDPTGEDFFDEQDELATVEPGLCSIDALASVGEIRPLPFVPVQAALDDESCFGEQGNAVIVSRIIGQGRIVRLASIGPLSNVALDDANNGALAARLFDLGSAPVVGFLPVAPVFDGEQQLVGFGQMGLLDLLPRQILALAVGLIGAIVLFALARARRLGSPVSEPVPVELPSSSYVQAVGRNYGAVAAADARSAAILRHSLRTDIARRLGVPVDTPVDSLADAIAPGDERKSNVINMLEGPPPADSDALVELAAEISAMRTSLDRAGVVGLMRSESIMEPAQTATMSSETRKDAS